MGDSWFRIYNTIRHDRKIARLNDQQFRAWINLLSVASEEGGIIPCNVHDLSHELRLTAGKVRDTLQVLANAGLIEADGNGYRPHNWNVKQFKHDVSTERVKRFRERHMKPDVTVSETRHETGCNGPQSTESETEKETTSLRSVSKKRFRSGLPDGFPFQGDLDWAAEYWICKGRKDLCDTISEQICGFRDHHNANAKTSADWPASWRTWVQNAVKFNRKHVNGQAPTAHENLQRGTVAAIEKLKQRYGCPD